MSSKKPKKTYRTLKEPATHGRFDRDKIRQVISGKTGNAVKPLKALKGIIPELPKLGKDAEQFLKDTGELKKLAGKYKGPADLAGKHDEYLSEDPIPGEILLLEFLKPMTISRARLARETGIPRKVIAEIISGKRGINEQEAEALGKFFKTGPEFWINLWAVKLKTVQKKLGPKAKGLGFASEDDVLKSLAKIKDSMPTKFDRVMRQIKLLQKIDAEIHDAQQFRANKKLRDKWHDIITSPAYRKEQPYVKTFIGLSFAVHEIGVNIQDLDALISAAITTTPLFANRFGYYGAAISAVQWVKSPHPELKGDIPWVIMQTEYGRRRVRKAMTAEFGSHLTEAPRETATRLHKIGLLTTKEKDDILKGKVELGIRPLEESFDNFVDTAEAIQRGEKVKVQKGIYFASVKALRKVLGNDTKMSEKDIAALAKLAAEGKVKLPTKKGKPKGVKGLKIKGKPLSDTIIKDRR